MAAAGQLSTKQKEDSWAWVEIGVPFPDGPVRVKGEQNQYVALWYKHGKPLCGRAWNNGGVVECSFPYEKKELTGKRDLGGQIQILTYDTNWTNAGFTYEWTQWKNRHQAHLQIVRCGDAIPILMRAKDGNNYCGNLNLSTGIASISYNGQTETTAAVDELLTITRNLQNPEPVPGQPEPPKIYDDIWTDMKENDVWSRTGAPILAMSRPLKTPHGLKEQHVALWYQHGQPVMGRIWNDGGKIAASFGWGGNEYTKNVGSLQVLAYDPKRAGFNITWLPYREASKVNAQWKPVKVKDCAPCVISKPDGTEYLGKVLMSEEKATFSYNGKEEIFTGPQVQNFHVLCRDK